MTSDPDASAYSDAISQRKMSCTEVMRDHLDRVARLNPAVNAVVSLRDPDALLAEAQAADSELARGHRRGWLHGLPFAVKDLAATAGLRSTSGSPLLATHVPAEDCLMVQRIRAAGAIIIGKTNTPEFGLGSHSYNPVFGVTRNAWDHRLSAGGSSGGAAVALALRLVPLADGSDMMGSLRNPAGWNNVLGFRPAFGRVPNGPSDEVFLHQLATDGPMARSARDLARFLDTLAGYSPAAPLSLPDEELSFAEGLDRDVKGLRVGWIGDWSGAYPTEPGVLDLARAGLAPLEAQGAEITPLAPDFDAAQLWNSWLTLRHWAVSQKLLALAPDSETQRLLKPEAQWELECGRSLTAAQIHAASTIRSAWAHWLTRTFERFDVLALPSAQIFAFPAEWHWPREIAGRAMDTYHRWMEVVVPGSLSGHPVAAVPAGFDPQGRAMGIQLIGRARADRALLQVVAAHERAADWYRLRPSTAF